MRSSIKTYCIVVLAAVSYLTAQGAALSQSPFDLLMPSRPKDQPNQNKGAADVDKLTQDPKSQQKFVKDCIQIMTVEFENKCNRNLPHLDKSSCKELLAKNKDDARKKCQRLADGETISMDFK